MARRGSADSLGPAPRYEMTADRLGICLIFNNRTFPNGIRERTGTDNDKEKLHAIFQTLKFDVRCYDNVSDTDMLLIISRAAQEDHARYNCFVCCILSHGAKGVVYGSNGVPIKIRKLTERLCPQSCPTLCGKPKVFVVQACQGGRVQRGHPEVQIDAVAAEDRLIPNEADFLVAYSTVPGYVAFRDVNEGSYFIQTLVEKLYKYAHEFDILRILTFVNYTVGFKDYIPAGEDYPQKQSPAQYNTLRKVLYLSSTPLNARPHPQSDESTSTVVWTADAVSRQQRGRVPDASQTVTSSCPPSSAQRQEVEDMSAFHKMLEEIHLSEAADTPCGDSVRKLKTMSTEKMKRAAQASSRSAQDQASPRNSSRDTPPASAFESSTSPPLPSTDTQHASRGHRPLSSSVSATVSSAGASALTSFYRQQSLPATLPAPRTSRATFPADWNSPKS